MRARSAVARADRCKPARTIQQSDEYEAEFHTDPYVLAPGAERAHDGETVAGWDSYRFDPDLRRFGGPFFMAPINARIVRRSLALDGHLPCTYEEGISVAAWLDTAWLYVSRGFGYFVGAPIPLRPQSGEGPPPWLQRAGSFCVRVHATTEDRARSALVEVRGTGDPGYLATSKMLTEVGLALLLDEAPPRGGVLTPATALGPVLRRPPCQSRGRPLHAVPRVGLAILKSLEPLRYRRNFNQPELPPSLNGDDPIPWKDLQSN